MNAERLYNVIVDIAERKHNVTALTKNEITEQLRLALQDNGMRRFTESNMLKSIIADLITILHNAAYIGADGHLSLASEDGLDRLAAKYFIDGKIRRDHFKYPDLLQ